MRETKGMRLEVRLTTNDYLKVLGKDLHNKLKIKGKSREAAAEYLLDKMAKPNSEKKINFMNSFMEKNNVREKDFDKFTEKMLNL